MRITEGACEPPWAPWKPETGSLEGGRAWTVTVAPGATATSSVATACASRRSTSSSAATEGRHDRVAPRASRDRGGRGLGGSGPGAPLGERRARGGDQPRHGRRRVARALGQDARGLRVEREGERGARRAPPAHRPACAPRRGPTCSTNASRRRRPSARRSSPASVICASRSSATARPATWRRPRSRRTRRGATRPTAAWSARMMAGRDAAWAVAEALVRTSREVEKADEALADLRARRALLDNPGTEMGARVVVAIEGAAAGAGNAHARVPRSGGVLAPGPSRPVRGGIGERRSCSRPAPRCGSTRARSGRASGSRSRPSARRSASRRPELGDDWLTLRPTGSQVERRGARVRSPDERARRR